MYSGSFTIEGALISSPTSTTMRASGKRSRDPNQKIIAANLNQSSDNGGGDGVRDAVRRLKKARKSLCLVTLLSNQCDDSALYFNFDPPILSGLNQKELWRNHEVINNTGVVVTVMGDPKKPVNKKFLHWRMRELIFGDGRGQNGEIVRQAVYELICTSSDSMGQVLEAISKFESTTRDEELVGEVDLQLWNAVPTASSFCRRLAFLHRMLSRPLCVKKVHLDIIQIQSLPFTFLKLLYDMSEIQEYVVDALLLQLSCLGGENTLENLLMKELVDFVSTAAGERSIHNTSAFEDILSFICQKNKSLVKFLPPSVLAHVRESVSVTSSSANKSKIAMWCRYSSKLLKQGTQKKHRPKQHVDTKSFEPSKREFRRRFAEERSRLVRRYSSKGGSENAENQSMSTRQTVSQGRKQNGGPLYTDDDMPLTIFMEETNFMEQINKSFPRKYFPGKSRPRLSSINLTEEKFGALKNLFFDTDGSLSDAIKQDIDTSSKHGYINFANLLCQQQRQDARWQVPIRKHYIGSIVETRQKAESILSDLYDSHLEAIYDLGILIGGTEDQSLHHDLARQIVGWIPEKYRTSEQGIPPIPGWEIDRLAFNEAMASPNAPISVVIGMGPSSVLLGVQRDQIVKTAPRTCRTRAGTGELFEIVRETDHLVVIKASARGVQFTGDFPHAGVRNIQAGSEEDKLLVKLIRDIDLLLKKYSEDDLTQIKAIIDLLCNFPCLDKLCRLHFSTKITSGNLFIPGNTVGFSDCFINPPDMRCLQEDKAFSPHDNDGTHWEDDEGEHSDDGNLLGDTEYSGDEEAESLPSLCSAPSWDLQQKVYTIAVHVCD
jgi:hypothetical protein